MHDCLAGTELISSDFRIPSLATVNLSGRTVREVVPRGKHLLMRISPDVTLHSHLRMDGSWHLYRQSARWNGGPSHEVRVVLRTAAWTAVGYRLQVLELLPTNSEQTVVGHLGPDLLGPDWDPVEAARRLVRDPDRPIGEALLDQRNLAGIGNLYKSECLFLAGVWPWEPVGTTRGLDAAIARAYDLLQLNKHRSAQITTGDRRAGRDHWVYRRVGQPCRRCGNAIQATRSATQGAHGEDRLTYWCPTCQPPSVPASRPTSWPTSSSATRETNPRYRRGTQRRGF
jgi:endonuclease VIII